MERGNIMHHLIFSFETRFAEITITSSATINLAYDRPIEVHVQSGQGDIERFYKIGTTRIRVWVTGDKGANFEIHCVVEPDVLNEFRFLVGRTEEFSLGNGTHLSIYERTGAHDDEIFKRHKISETERYTVMLN